MTPAQKELLVLGQMSSHYFLSKGEYASIAAMHRKGWVTDLWSFSLRHITPAGYEALKQACPTYEIYNRDNGLGVFLLKEGRPIAKAINIPDLEDLLANSNL